MKKCKILFIYMCLFLIGICIKPLLVGAQNSSSKQIKGIVTNETAESMVGVSVVVKGTTNGTLTDANGGYSINASANDVLVFSFIGYATESKPVGSNRTIDLQMQPDAQMMDEAVVVGALGIKKLERKLGYSVTEVKGEELTRTNSINPISALQGKVAGLNINISGSSGIQATPSFTIRGTKSLSSNSQPIFVVDGVIMEMPGFANTQGADWGSQLKNLNPDDYENITVLKGAAATALYGSRGANGAIVITNKSGKKNPGIGIEVSQTMQFESVYKNYLKMQNEYGMGYWGNYEGGYDPSGNVPFTANSWGMKMEGQMVNVPWRDDKVPFVAQPDNWKTFYQTGSFYNTNVALSRATDNVAYRLSYSHTDANGVLPKNGITRDAFSIKSSGDLGSIFKVDFGLNFARSSTLNAGEQGRWSGGNFGYQLAYGLPRNFNLADWKANYRKSDQSMKTYTYGTYTGVADIFHRMDYRTTMRYEDSYMSNVGLTAKLAPWLDARGQVTYNFYKIFMETKEYGKGANLAGGYFGQFGGNSNDYNFLFSLHGAKTLMNNKLDLDGRIFTEIYGNGMSEGWEKGTNGGLLIPGFFSFNNSMYEVRPSASFGYQNRKVVGFAGVFNIGWDNQLNLELTGRNDWHSSLLYPKSNPYGKNNFSTFYPSANLSWIFTETFKDQLPTWLSYGKTRSSISRVGYGTSPYATNGTWGYSQGTMRDEDGKSVTTGGVNGANTIQNFDIKPELQQEIELGADIRFFDSRLGLDFAWYKKNTYNQIMSIGNTPESGASQRWINAGNIQNKGIELLVTVTPVLTKDIRWDMSFNYSRNRGKIVKFYEGISEYRMMDEYEGVQVWATEGGRFGVMTSNKVRGTYQAYDGSGNKINDGNNGKYVARLSSDKTSISYVYEEELYNRWRSDYNKVDETEAYKRTELGSVEADFYFGHMQTFRYKNFDLSASIDGRVGGKIFSSSYLLGMGRGNLEGTLQYRDAARGGVNRVGTDGKTYDNGVIPQDVVFDKNTIVVSNKTGANIDLSGKTFQEAVDAGHIAPLHVGAYYQGIYGWNQNIETAVFDNTWIALREVTMGYSLPKTWVQKLSVQGLRVGFTARNILYLYNGLKGGLNPESLQGNNPMAPVEYGATPHSRNFAFSVKLSF